MDEISILNNTSISHHFKSSYSRLAWTKMTLGPSAHLVGSTFYHASPVSDDDFSWNHTVEWEWRWQCSGFEFGNFIPMGVEIHEAICIIPYWSLILPLTVLSAWLLLAKPCQSIQNKTAESIPEKVN